MKPTTIRTKKITDYIQQLESRKVVRERQAAESKEPLNWVLEGEVKAIELIVDELNKLISKKER